MVGLNEFLIVAVRFIYSDRVLCKFYRVSIKPVGHGGVVPRYGRTWVNSRLHRSNDLNNVPAILCIERRSQFSAWPDGLNYS